MSKVHVNRLEKLYTVWQNMAVYYHDLLAQQIVILIEYNTRCYEKPGQKSLAWVVYSFRDQF